MSIMGGPLDRNARLEIRDKLQHPVQCTDVVGALQHILLASVLNAEKHRRLSVRWSRLHYLLGLPAAIATAVGAIGLAYEGMIGWAAYVILASGIFSASLTFLRCAELRDRNGSLCAGWTALADCVRLTLFAYQADLEAGEKPMHVLKQHYRKCLVELNQEKMKLLWGVLRAGPAQRELLSAGTGAPLDTNELPPHAPPSVQPAPLSATNGSSTN